MTMIKPTITKYEKRLLSIARHFVWADKMKEKFSYHLRRDGIPKIDPMWYMSDIFMYMALWYALLFEVLEKLRSENLELKNSINEFSERKLSIESLEADNINLNNVISELIQNQTQLVNYNLSSDQSLPKYYQTNLFMRIFNILDNPKKDLIIRTLIQDLITTLNNDIKRSVINLLSSIKDKRIYDALLKMIHDEDWLIRLYIIKTLYKFDVNEIKDHFTEPLKALLKDKDSDVRDAASRILNYIYNGG